MDYFEFERWFFEFLDDLDRPSEEENSITPSLDNWIRLEKNFGYDPSRIDSPHGDFYYPFIIHVFTKHNMDISAAHFEKQLEFARILTKKLRELGCILKLHAEFEKDL